MCSKVQTALCHLYALCDVALDVWPLDVDVLIEDIIVIIVIYVGLLIAGVRAERDLTSGLLQLSHGKLQRPKKSQIPGFSRPITFRHRVAKFHKAALGSGGD